MNGLVSQAKCFNKNLKSNVLINRATTNPIVNEVNEAKDVLQDFENLTLSPFILKDRISYRKAARSGLAVVELEKQDIKAISEIKTLYNEVFND
jgi:chromosome partitioning protein